jgi:hypothetical protein
MTLFYRRDFPPHLHRRPNNECARARARAFYARDRKRHKFLPAQRNEIASRNDPEKLYGEFNSSRGRSSIPERAKAGDPAK